MNNHLTGGIPDSLGTLANLERVRINGNSLTLMMPKACYGTA